MRRVVNTATEDSKKQKKNSRKRYPILFFQNVDLAFSGIHVLDEHTCESGFMNTKTCECGSIKKWQRMREDPSEVERKIG